jgi:ABC-type microcin C transport system permease subunit YejE
MMIHLAIFAWMKMVIVRNANCVTEKPKYIRTSKANGFGTIAPLATAL